MNRHQRRRRAVVAELRTIRRDEIDAHGCGWEGCRAFYTGDLPAAGSA
jgi:hypothetical protein